MVGNYLKLGNFSLMASFRSIPTSWLSLQQMCLSDWNRLHKLHFHSKLQIKKSNFDQHLNFCIVH